MSAPHNIYPLMKRPVGLEMIWDIIFLVGAVEVLTFNILNYTCTYESTFTLQTLSVKLNQTEIKR